MLDTLIDKVKVVIIVLVLFIVIPGLVGYVETHYTRVGCVTSVHGDRVVVCDDSNNEWEFIGKDFTKGDVVRLSMFTGFTDDTLFDDEIVNAKKIKR